MGVRTMIFDATGRGGRGQWALTASWVAGARLYGALGRLDHHRGVHSWAEALEYLATVGDGRQSIDEVQFWGHGLVGRAFIGRDILDIDGLSRDHPMASAWRRVRARLTASSLWWFRTCDTFGTHTGHRFATALADDLGCRVAGHTFIIGPWQSGLHSLRPGQTPQWSVEEGNVEGDNRWSRPGAPNTIHCLQGTIPAGW
jgi:hypothetical protein